MKNFASTITFAVIALTVLPACGGGKKAKHKTTTVKTEECAPCNKAAEKKALKYDKEEYQI